MNKFRIEIFDSVGILLIIEVEAVNKRETLLTIHDLLKQTDDFVQIKIWKM